MRSCYHFFRPTHQQRVPIIYLRMYINYYAILIDKLRAACEVVCIAENKP